MIRRLLASLCAVLLTAQAAAPATVRVVLTTNEGPITLELEAAKAPKTTANFLRYLDAKRLDGIDFYRAMRLGDTGGIIQAGVRDPRKWYPPLPHEPTTQTGLKHVAGTISMARLEPGSARADFFILASDIPGFDANPALPGDNAGFAAFGHVVDGMEIVNRILLAPTDPAKGEGAMKGQMIAVPVKILTARRVP